MTTRNQTLKPLLRAFAHEAKTKENHKRELAKLSPSFSPEARICLRSYIKHLH